MSRRRVILESPLKNYDPAVLAENLRFLRLCMRDCIINHNEAPFASHALYPQFLDDFNDAERAMGIDAGLRWGELAEASIVYTNRGISPGMKLGIDHAHAVGRKVEYRSLAGYVSPVPAQS